MILGGKEAIGCWGINPKKILALIDPLDEYVGVHFLWTATQDSLGFRTLRQLGWQCWDIGVVGWLVFSMAERRLLEIFQSFHSSFISSMSFFICLWSIQRGSPVYTVPFSMLTKESASKDLVCAEEAWGGGVGIGVFWWWFRFHCWLDVLCLVCWSSDVCSWGPFHPLVQYYSMC